MKWSFYQIWNESLEKGRPERELVARNRMWASELGGSYIDRFLKMSAVKPTNPPNPRSMRKFEAGNMMEWIVGLVLKRAGILIENQQWLSHQYPTLLEVTGKLDFFAGGKPDWEKAKTEIDALGLPEFFNRATESIIAHFADKFKDGLEEIVIEVKSCSAFMFDRYDALGKPNPQHALQTFHYLKAKNMPEAHIVYICKDDLRMVEFGVFNPSETEALYKKDIETMTNFMLNKQQPEKEKEIVFDEETYKFSSNWKVAYSNYLTLLYGFKDQFEFDGKYKPMVSSWNRVFKRIVTNQNMTPLNKQVIAEIKKTFPNLDELVETAKKNNAFAGKEGEEDASES